MAKTTVSSDPSPELGGKPPRGWDKLVSNLILEWAAMDFDLTAWVILEFGMKEHEGRILLGNMDARTKINRLKALFQQRQDTEMATSLATLEKRHADYADVRNAICHTPFLGFVKDDPSRLGFGPLKSMIDEETVIVQVVHVELLKRATKFARDTSLHIRDCVESRRRDSPL
jgi:hypothetical protein